MLLNERFHNSKKLLNGAIPIGGNKASGAKLTNGLGNSTGVSGNKISTANDLTKGMGNSIGVAGKNNIVGFERKPEIKKTGASGDGRHFTPAELVKTYEQKQAEQANNLKQKQENLSTRTGFTTENNRSQTNTQQAKRQEYSGIQSIVAKPVIQKQVQPQYIPTTNNNSNSQPIQTTVQTPLGVGQNQFFNNQTESLTKNITAAQVGVGGQKSYGVGAGNVNNDPSYSVGQNVNSLVNDNTSSRLTGSNIQNAQPLNQPAPLVNSATQTQFNGYTASSPKPISQSQSVQSQNIVQVGQQSQYSENKISSNDPLNKGFLAQAQNQEATPIFPTPIIPFNSKPVVAEVIPVGQQSQYSENKISSNDPLNKGFLAQAQSSKQSPIENVQKEKVFGIGENQATQIAKSILNNSNIGVIEDLSAEPVLNEVVSDATAILTKDQIIDRILRETLITIASNCRNVTENYLVDIGFAFPKDIEDRVASLNLRAKIGREKDFSSSLIRKDPVGKWYALVDIGALGNSSGGFREILLDLGKSQPKDELFSNQPKPGVYLTKADYGDPKYKENLDNHNYAVSVQCGEKYGSTATKEKYELYKKIAKETKFSKQTKSEFKSKEPIELFLEMPKLGETERIPKTLRIVVNDEGGVQYLVQIDTSNPNPDYFKYSVNLGSRIYNEKHDKLFLSLVAPADVTGQREEFWKFEKIRTIRILDEESKVKGASSNSPESETLKNFKEVGSKVNITLGQNNKDVIKVGQSSSKSKVIGLTGALGLSAIAGAANTNNVLNGGTTANGQTNYNNSENKTSNADYQSNSTSSQGTNRNQNRQSSSQTVPIGNQSTSTQRQTYSSSKANQNSQNQNSRNQPLGSAARPPSLIPVDPNLPTSVSKQVNNSIPVGGQSLSLQPQNIGANQRGQNQNFGKLAASLGSINANQPNLSNASYGQSNLPISSSLGSNKSPVNSFGQSPPPFSPIESLNILRNSSLGTSPQFGSKNLPNSGVISAPYQFANNISSTSINSPHNPGQVIQFGGINRDRPLIDAKGNPIPIRKNNTGPLRTGLSATLTTTDTILGVATAGILPANSIGRANSSISNNNSYSSNSTSDNSEYPTQNPQNQSRANNLELDSDGGNNGNQPPNNRPPKRTGGNDDPWDDENDDDQFDEQNNDENENDKLESTVEDDSDEDRFSQEQLDKGREYRQMLGQREADRLGKEYTPEQKRLDGLTLEELLKEIDDEAALDKEKEGDDSNSDNARRLLSGSQMENLVSGNRPKTEQELQDEIDLNQIRDQVKNPKSNNPFAPNLPDLKNTIDKAIDKNVRNEIIDRIRNRIPGYRKLNNQVVKSETTQSDNNPLRSKQNLDTQPIKRNVGDFAKKQATKAATDFAKKAAFQFFLANAWWILPTILALLLMLAFVGGIIAIECDNGKSDVRTFKIVDTAITAFEATSAAAQGNIVSAVGKAVEAGLGTAEALVVYDSGLIRSDLNRFISKLPGCNAPCETQGVATISNAVGQYGQSGGKVTAKECEKLKEYKAFIDEAANDYGIPAPFIGAILSQETEVGLGGSINPKGCEGRGDTGGRGHGLGQVDQASGAFGNIPTNPPQQFPVGTKLVKDGKPILDKKGKQLTWSDCRDNIMYVAFHLDEVKQACKSDLKGGNNSAEYLKGLANGYNRWCGGVKDANITAKRDGLTYGESVINRAADVAKCFGLTTNQGIANLSPDKFNQPIQLAKLNETKQSLNDSISELVGFPVSYKSPEENLKRPNMRSYGIQALDDRINEFNQIMGGRMIVEAADTGAETEATIRTRVSGYYDKGDFYQVKPITTDDKNGTLKTGYDLNIVKFLDDLHKSGLAIVTGPRSWGRSGGDHVNPSRAIDIWGVGYLKDITSGGGIKGFKIGQPGGEFAGGAPDTAANNGNVPDPRIRRHNDIPLDPIAKELFEKIYDIAFASSTGKQFIAHKDFKTYLNSKGKNKVNTSGKLVQDDLDIYKFYNGAHFHHFHVALVSYFQKPYNGGSITVDGSAKTPDECCPDNSVVTPNPPVQGPYQQNEDIDDKTDLGGDVPADQLITPPTPTVTYDEDTGGDATGDEQTGTTPQFAPVDTTLDSNAIGFLNFFQSIKASAVTVADVVEGGKKRGYSEELAIGESDLISINLAPGGNSDTRVTKETAQNWKEMVAAAKLKGINLGSYSAYRNIAAQTKIIQDKINAGQTLEKILSASVPPGYSQHHTGRAIDINSTDTSFGETPAYKWLAENALKFGFSQTYLKDNKAGASWEPWHWFYFKGYPGYDQTTGVRNSGPKEAGATTSGANGGSSGSTGTCCPGNSSADTATTTTTSTSSSSTSSSSKKSFLDFIQPIKTFALQKGTVGTKDDGIATEYFPGGGGIEGGKLDSGGKVIDLKGYSAASMKWSYGTKAKVTNRLNGKSVIVEINDTGAFGPGTAYNGTPSKTYKDTNGGTIKGGDRIIDLISNAARVIGAVENSETPVTVEIVDKSATPGPTSGNKVLLSNQANVDCVQAGVVSDGSFASIMKKISDQYQCGQTIKSSEIIGKAGVDWPTIDYRKNGTGCCYGAVTGGLKIAELSDPSSGWGKAYSIIKNKLNYNKAVDFHTSMQADGGGGKKLYEAAGLKFTQDPKAAPAGAIIVIGQGATVKSSAGDINVKVADGQFVNYAPMNWMNTVPSNEILGVYYPG